MCLVQYQIFPILVGSKPHQGESSYADSRDISWTHGWNTWLLIKLIHNSVANLDCLSIAANSCLMESNEKDQITGQESVEKDARAHLELERALTIRQAIRYYMPAIFWCLVVRSVIFQHNRGFIKDFNTNYSMTVVMEGYDTILIGNFWAYPTFQKKYGENVGVGDTTPSGYQISPSWQAGLSNAGAIGAICGTSIIIVKSKYFMLLIVNTLRWFAEWDPCRSFRPKKQPSRLSYCTFLFRLHRFLRK